MKRIINLLALFLTLASCFGQTNYGGPEVDPIKIQNNFLDWQTYQNRNIMLSRNFTALNVSSKEISKEAFLKELANGNFIPIRLLSNDSIIYYKLFKILPNSDTSIKATIESKAFEEFENFKMEGQKFPSFSFTDLDGKTITNDSAKGKLMVIKCWYIHCPACIREFPAVNKMVEEYKNRKDILFVSLAEDSPQELKVFLAKKHLSYTVVPNMKKYMNETLLLNAFPTHFIINKQGFISKVLNNSESLEWALKEEIKKQQS